MNEACVRIDPPERRQVTITHTLHQTHNGLAKEGTDKAVVHFIFIWGISVKVHLIWRKNSHCILPSFKRIPGDLPTLPSESSDGSLSSSVPALET